jgi:hypothetical protein
MTQARASETLYVPTVSPKRQKNMAQVATAWTVQTISATKKSQSTAGTPYATNTMREVNDPANKVHFRAVLIYLNAAKAISWKMNDAGTKKLRALSVSARQQYLMRNGERITSQCEQAWF